MWPRCRGRRLPVKLTGAPAAPAAAAGGTDSSSDGPPLSLVLDCSLQAAPDGTETRVKAVASLPDTADDSCGCPRKPCCCAPTTQKKQDEPRPATYQPREALFRMRGGRKVRLTPVSASGTKGEPEGLFEQTRLLPRSQHRRLILADTAAGGQGKTAAGTTSTKPAKQQVQNPAQQVACTQHQAPATGETSRAGTHTAVEEAVQGDRQRERLGGQQLLLFLLLPNTFPLQQASLSELAANTKPLLQTTKPTTKEVSREDPYRGPFKGQKEHMSERLETQIRRTNASTQEAQHGDYRADTLDSQKEPSLARLATFNRVLQAEMQQQSTYPTTKDVCSDYPYRGPFNKHKAHMSERPETQIRGTNSSTQEAQHGNYRADTLDSQKEPSLSRLATFSRDLQAKMQQQPCGNCNPATFSCQHGPLPSQPETSKQNISIAIVEVPRSDCSLETLNGQQESLSSVPGTLRRGMHVAPHSDDSLERLKSQWELLPSKLGTSRYNIHIPVQESLHSGRKPQTLSSHQELLSSIPGTQKYGIHIPIKKPLHSEKIPKRLSSQHIPLSSTLGTFKYGIHIPNHEAPCSDCSTERLSGRQGLLFSRQGTSKYGIHIPLQGAPRVCHSPERVRAHQKLVISRPGTSKHGIYIPIQEAHHSGFNYEKLSSQQKPLSSRSGTSQHGIRIPVQVAHHIAHSPERLSSQPEPLSSRLGTPKYGIRIPVQVANHIAHNPERLRSQPESLLSRLGTSNYGPRIPFQVTSYSYCSPEKLSNQEKVMSSRSATSRHGIVVPNSGHHLGKFTGQNMTMSSEVTTQEPCQDKEPVHTTDKQTQMPEEPEKHAQGTPHVTEEEPPQNHRSWILGFLLDRLFGTRKPSTQGIRPTTMHGGSLSEGQYVQLWEMLVTSALMAHSVQLEQMAEKVEGSRNPNHYEIQKESLPDGGPNHISEDHMREPARSEANVQVIPSAIEEAPLEYRHSAIFSFLQDQLIARLKESIKRTQPKRRDGLQEEHHSEECRSGHQLQVSTTRNESKENIHSGELHIDHHHECDKGLQEQVPTIPETTTEHISNTLEEKFNAQQEQISEKIKNPIQHLHTGVEIVLHENHSSEDLKFQQKQLSERAHTSMQDIQSIMEHTLHVEEPLEHEQLSKVSETPIQSLQPKSEDAACEEEQLSESPQPPIQSMKPTKEDVFSKEELLEQKQLPASLQTSVQDIQPTGKKASYQEEQFELEEFSATPQTSIQEMPARMEEVLSEEEQLEQKQLPTSLQTSMQDIQHIFEEAPHEKKQLEQEQLSPRSQTYMQSMQRTTEEVPHEEEPQEQDQLSVASQTSMEGMERVIEGATLDEKQLEEKQLLAWPQTSMQDVQPTTEDESYEEERLEQEQLSVTLQTSIQSLQSVTEEAPYEEKPPEQEQLSVSPETSMQSMQTTREYAPHREELEEVQLSATLQAFKQVLQPIMLEARYEEGLNETPVSQKVQASTVATTSEQEIPFITEASDADNSASVRQKRTAARLVRSVIDARPKKLKSPHLAAFRSLHERVSKDQKSVEKRIFPSEKVVPAARGERLHHEQDQMTEKLNLLGKNRNNVAEETDHNGRPLDK